MLLDLAELLLLFSTLSIEYCPSGSGNMCHRDSIKNNNNNNNDNNDDKNIKNNVNNDLMENKLFDNNEDHFFKTYLATRCYGN